jgi:nucleoside-diphosphate-sugar epimerase
MNVLVVGATGMTGRALVEQLLSKGKKVRVIARSPQKLPVEVIDHPNVTLIEASVLDLTELEMVGHTRDCDAVISCLGHVMDLKGLFGNPRRLCAEATRRLCDAIEENRPAQPVKFILMNTVGVENPDLEEKRAWYECCLLKLLHHTLPPHRDNEIAAAHLHQHVGKESKYIEWCSVRPDSLINAEVSAYDIEESPTTGIFTGRPTARANVAHFMIELIENAGLWSTWRFRMPVIMNSIERGDPRISVLSFTPPAV